MAGKKAGRQFPKHDSGKTSTGCEEKFSKGGDSAMKGGKGKNAGLNNIGPVNKSGRP